MYSAVIIDDEDDAIQVLAALLSNFTSFKLKIAGTAKKLSDGIELIKHTNPDIVFLDIDMPGKNGMEIYQHFSDPTFKIIFVTAYEQYAIDAVNNNAFGYLLKPVNFLNLQSLLLRAVKQLKKEQKQYEMEDKLNAFFTANIEGKNIALDVVGGILIENTRNIEYCYANQSYSQVVLHTGKEIIVSKPLKWLQEMLPNTQFYRTHKSYLVNIFYIRKIIKGNESYVMLKSGIKIPVSVRISTTFSNDIKSMLLV